MITPKHKTPVPNEVKGAKSPIGSELRPDKECQDRPNGQHDALYSVHRRASRMWRNKIHRYHNRRRLGR